MSKTIEYDPEYFTHTKWTEEEIKKRKERHEWINGFEYERWKEFTGKHYKQGCRTYHLELYETGIGTHVKAVCNDCQHKKFKKIRRIEWIIDITDYDCW